MEEADWFNAELGLLNVIFILTVPRDGGFSVIVADWIFFLSINITEFTAVAPLVSSAESSRPAILPPVRLNPPKFSPEA